MCQKVAAVTLRQALQAHKKGLAEYRLLVQNYTPWRRP